MFQMRPWKMRRRPEHYLHNCVRLDWRNTARSLIERGADINAPCKYGYTPLMIAVMWNRVEIVQLLLESGVDTKKADRYGYIAIDMIPEGANEIRRLLCPSDEEG